MDRSGLVNIGVQRFDRLRSCRKITDTDCAGYFSYFPTDPKGTEGFLIDEYEKEKENRRK